MLAIAVPWLALAAAVGFGVLINAAPGEHRHQDLPGLTYDEESAAQSAPADLVVTSIQNGGAADNANVAVGDVITAVDGVPVRSGADVSAALERAQAQKVDLRLTRQGQPIETSLPAPRAHGIMGS